MDFFSINIAIITEQYNESLSIQNTSITHDKCKCYNLERWKSSMEENYEKAVSRAVWPILER